MLLENWPEILFIFTMRLGDVSLGTLRISMLVRGYRLLAAALSFLESILWLIATAKVLTSLQNPSQFLAFAGGYAMGTFVGSTIEQWLALGENLLRVIAPTDSPPVADALHQLGLQATVLNAQGDKGEVRIVFCIIPARQRELVLRTVGSVNPDALTTIEQITTADLQRYSIPKNFSGWFARLKRR